MGRGLNADKTVSGLTTRFKLTDPIYVAVLTDGAGSGNVKARWLYAGRVVSEPELDALSRVGSVGRPAAGRAYNALRFSRAAVAWFDARPV